MCRTARKRLDGRCSGRSDTEHVNRRRVDYAQDSLVGFPWRVPHTRPHAKHCQYSIPSNSPAIVMAQTRSAVRHCSHSGGRRGVGSRGRDSAGICDSLPEMVTNSRTCRATRVFALSPRALEDPLSLPHEPKFRPRVIGKSATQPDDYDSCDRRDPESPLHSRPLRFWSLDGPAGITRYAYEVPSRLRPSSDVLAAPRTRNRGRSECTRAVTLVLNVSRRRAARGSRARPASVQVSCRANSLTACAGLSAMRTPCGVRVTGSGRGKF